MSSPAGELSIHFHWLMEPSEVNDASAAYPSVGIDPALNTVTSEASTSICWRIYPILSRYMSWDSIKLPFKRLTLHLWSRRDSYLKLWFLHYGEEVINHKDVCSRGCCMSCSMLHVICERWYYFNIDFKPIICDYLRHLQVDGNRIVPFWLPTVHLLRFGCHTVHWAAFSGAFTPVSRSIKLPHILLFKAIFFLYILKKSQYFLGFICCSLT